MHGYENSKIWIMMIFGQRKLDVHRRLCRDCEQSGTELKKRLSQHRDSITPEV